MTDTERRDQCAADRAMVAAIVRANRVVASLATALHLGATLAWCVEHAAGDADRLAWAWPLSNDGLGMALVLRNAGHHAWPAVERAWRAAGCERTGFHLATCVREHVPTVALADLLAAWTKP